MVRDAKKRAREQKKLEQQEQKSANQSEKLRRRIKRSEHSVKDYQYFILRLLIFIVVIWVLFFKLIGVTHMPNNDMYPRLDSGDMVLFYRLDKNVVAQDIIAFESTTPEHPDSKELFICRVVAVAGDTVEITDAGQLLINGNAVIESNIFYSTPRYVGYTEYPLTLGEGECFVLSDSRNSGTDSRYFGPVKKENILGTVITILRRNNL